MNGQLEGVNPDNSAGMYLKGLMTTVGQRSVKSQCWKKGTIGFIKHLLKLEREPFIHYISGKKFGNFTVKGILDHYVVKLKLKLEDF